MKKIIIIAVALLGSAQLFAQNNNNLNESGLTPEQVIANDKLVAARNENLRKIEEQNINEALIQKAQKRVAPESKNLDGKVQVTPVVAPVTAPVTGRDTDALPKSAPTASPKTEELIIDNNSSTGTRRK